METENKSYTVTQYMKALKQKVESTPAVWVRGVITQINEKSKIVFNVRNLQSGTILHRNVQHVHSLLRCG